MRASQDLCLGSGMVSEPRPVIAAKILEILFAMIIGRGFVIEFSRSWC
jgi:hypothetical protein